MTKTLTDDPIDDCASYFDPAAQRRREAMWACLAIMAVGALVAWFRAAAAPSPA